PAIPALGINVTGTLDAEISFTGDIGVGISRQNGDAEIYLDTDLRDTLGNKLPALKAGFDLKVPDLDAKGTLAFLNVELTDQSLHPSDFNGNFTVNLLDPQHDDNRLTLDDINSGVS